MKKKIARRKRSRSDTAQARRRLLSNNRVGEDDESWQLECVNDYERVARVIQFLDERHMDQPDLTTLARCAGLSRFHFHRLFSSWAGVTPKDFLQCLTLAHAKALLRDGENTLDTALASGLSGPGRLHDLCVTLNAASPGELKSGGDGWTIVYGFAQSPFGECLIAESVRGLCHLAFVQNKQAALAELKADWPQAKREQNDAVAAKFSKAIFNLHPEAKTNMPLRAFVRGTEFQVRVWRALLHIRPGSLTTYGRLAHWLGNRNASRAVGTAVGKNPLAYLIPCHRVIRETGVLGGYHWGLERKHAMIAWESAAARSRP